MSWQKGPSVDKENTEGLRRNILYAEASLTNKVEYTPTLSIIIGPISHFMKPQSLTDDELRYH